MAGGLRFRSEAIKIATTSFPVATTVIVATSLLTGIQRAGIYRLILSGNSTTAATFTFQDTGPNAISAVYNLAANGIFFLDVPINGDPWFQATAAALGLQIVVTGATITGDIYWAAGA